MSPIRHVAVIGAGITGITTAYALLRRGFEVTVFDRQPYAAMETSFANGGQLSASNAAVWNRWSTVLKGMKWMLTKDAPLLMNPRPGLHKYGWMAEFLRAIPHYERNTVETVRLAIAAREHLLSWAEEEKIAFDVLHRGILHVFEDDGEFEAAHEVTRLLKRGGLERQRVSPDEIAALDASLPRGRYVGGYHTPSDFTGDVHKYAMGLARACEQRGASLRFNATVGSLMPMGERGVDIEWTEPDGTDRRRFDSIVVCAGVASRAIGKALGDRVNVYPVKGYSVTVMLNDEGSRDGAPTISLLDEASKIVTSRLGDRFRIAGTAEFNGTNKDIRADRIRPLVDWCRRNFPGVSTEHVVPWAGLRPMMPDMLPRVGRGTAPCVFYNTGHGHLGWTLSAATADAIAASVEAQAMRNAA